MNLKPGDLVQFTRSIPGEELGYSEYERVIWENDLAVVDGEEPSVDGAVSVTLFNEPWKALPRQGWWVCADALKRLPEYAQPWHPGMKVTVKKEIHAYYSGYHRPIQLFRPGMVGTIGSVMVPFVTHAYRNHTKYPYFVCVDFVGDDGEMWRAGVDYENLARVER